MIQGILLGLLMEAAVCATGQFPPPQEVHAQGCVRSGVEVGCLMAVTLDGKTTYNILVAKKPPKAGDVIEFWGKEHQGPTTCMQGKAVKVDKWKLLKMPCPLPPATKR